jgi:outer membrane immunogenic protein
MKRLATAITAIALIGTPAFAADMAVKMPVKSPPPVRAPAYSWTGFYIGGNLGAAFGQHQWDPANNFGQPCFGCAPFGATGPLGASYDSTSFMGGGQIGANYQIGSTVLGVEGDFDWIDKTAFAATCNQPLPVPPFPGVGARTRCQSTTRWLASATVRTGYALDRLFPYVKGGAAWTRDLYQFGRGEARALADFPMFQTETTRAGWTVGAGVEYAFLPSWSTFLEYDYYGFGTDQVNLDATANIGPGFVPEPMKIGLNIQTLKVGLNYQFH